LYLFVLTQIEGWDMAAIRHDIELRVGATFTLLIACVTQPEVGGAVEVRDLTGWTGAMQIRASAEAETVLAAATVTIDEANGVVTATFTDDATALMTWRSGVYDLIITDGQETDVLAMGNARLLRAVTR
jgi:hypothetical protein